MADEEKYNVAQGYNSGLVQEALGYGQQANQQQRAAGMASIGAAEQGMMEMIGKMQLQNERAIADRRMKALRSGATSSSLAAMEMQNMQTGQIGAQQIMQDAYQQRMLMEQEYAGKDAMNRQFMFETLNQNTKDVAAIDAQKYSSNIIPGLREEYPDASADVLMVMAQKLQGIPLSKEDTNILNEYRASTSARNTSGTYQEAYKTITQNGVELQGNYSEEAVQTALFSKDEPVGEKEFRKYFDSEGNNLTNLGKRVKLANEAYDAYIAEFNRIKGTEFKPRSIFRGYKD